MTDAAEEPGSVTVHVELPPPAEPEPVPELAAVSAADVAALLAAEQRATAAEAENARLQAELSTAYAENGRRYDEGFTAGKSERETAAPVVEPEIVVLPEPEPEDEPEVEAAEDMEPETAAVHPVFRPLRDWLKR
jgi:hypothetical protein